MTHELAEYIERNIKLIDRFPDELALEEFYSNLPVDCLQECNQALINADVDISLLYTYYRMFKFILQECIMPSATDTSSLYTEHSRYIHLDYSMYSSDALTYTILHIRYDVETDEWMCELIIDEYTQDNYYVGTPPDERKEGTSWKELITHLATFKWNGITFNLNFLKEHNPSLSKHLRKVITRNDAV